ncbi:MAG: hypothetical protein ACO3ZZ_09025, partial [Solirubrobacterales bacterium]
MFLPGDVAVVEGHKVQIVAADGHEVQIGADWIPEHLCTRELPPKDPGMAPLSLDEDRLDWKVRGDLITALEAMSLDWGTHYQSGRVAVRKPQFDFSTDWLCTAEEARAIFSAHKEGKPLDGWTLVARKSREGCLY